jgi:hypothetical protein
MPTPLRRFRCPDDLWAQASAKAQAEGTNVTERLVDFLRRYAQTVELKQHVEPRRIGGDPIRHRSYPGGTASFGPPEDRIWAVACHCGITFYGPTPPDAEQALRATAKQQGLRT